MGSGNSKKKARKNKKDIVDNPRKLKHFTTVIFTKNVTKMGDLRKALDSGYNVNLQTEQTHSTLLHLAAVSDYVGQLSSLALVKELVKRKADLDIENDEGFRPLHLACGLRDMDARNLNTQVAMMLIESGADPVTPSKEDWTPLHYAAAKGRHKIMQALLQRKADPTIATPEEGQTTLHLVLGGAHGQRMADDKMNKMVVLLLQHKADPNARNASLQLPLELALTHFFHQAATSLIALGCGVMPGTSVHSLLDSHKALNVALRKDEERLLLVDVESEESVPSPDHSHVAHHREETVEAHVQAIEATDRWVAKYHFGNRITILHYLKENEIDFGQVLACTRINDAFRLILSAIVTGIDLVAFEHQDHGQAISGHSAIARWLTANLEYFQQYEGQLHSAENQKIAFHAVIDIKISMKNSKKRMHKQHNNNKGGGKSKKRGAASARQQQQKEQRVEADKHTGVAPKPRRLTIDEKNFDAEDEEISPFKMLQEVCRTRHKYQDHIIATVHLKERLHSLFEGMTKPEMERKHIRQDDDNMVPRVSQTDGMTETSFGFALVMMGRALTSGFTARVRALLQEKMETQDYTIMEAKPKAFSRMFTKIQTDYAGAEPPRYAENVDVMRMGVVFDSPTSLRAAAEVLMANMEVIRTKNAYVLKEGDLHGGYKSCMLNLRYTDPSAPTFASMAEGNRADWQRYIDEDTKSRYKANARKALKWLCALGDKPVAMACEVQLIYKPYLAYRKNVHFLYKVLRAETLEQFLRDFAPKTDQAVEQTKVVNKRRAKWAKQRSTRHSVRLLGATHKSKLGMTLFPQDVGAPQRHVSGAAAAAATAAPRLDVM